MPSKDCPNCGSRVDMTKDGLYGHCASCNNILDFSGEQQQEKPGSAASQGEKKQQQTDGKGVAGNEEKK